ncbi:phytochrome-like protein [Melanomma pulvis-pyrius CBS 109.77]|uniref:Phytochrome-like protein n=1 Tax=Melanomma pulvis-pyrius CBS 109.77 TaxID=1314802 RepID=A0A6A6XI01_9PLEO|nr:phytochrome-like protein [Melanomma pulvis-pyrius CBS 109.77]
MERVFPIRCTILGDIAYTRYSSPEIDQQQVVLVDSPTSERSDPLSRNSETSHTVNTTHDVSPTQESPPIEVVEDMVNSLPAKDALVYTECGEYAFTGEQGHGVITGNRAQFTRCEDEQIHIPGAIQPHGMLIGLDTIEDTETRYCCRVVSENSEDICRYTPRVLLSLNDFLSILAPSHRLAFHKCVSGIKNQFTSTLKSHEPKVFPVSFQQPEGETIPVWCAAHFVGGEHNLLVCEFELRNRPSSDKMSRDLPSSPFASLDSDPLDAVLSFVNKSMPLNIDLDDMFGDQGTTMELLDVMSQIQHQLSSQKDIENLLDVIVGLMMQLTGFHRCMVYRFDEEYNGKVVSELLNPRASSDIFKGLHFPSTDIPNQARELYKINRVRVLFDREEAACRLIYKAPKDLESPLDLTHSYLRAMSPVHLKYLKNMQVRSTMSVSLDNKNDLWGLICCHSYGPTGVRVSFPVREAVYWLGLCASNCLEKLLMAERIQRRQAASTMQLNFSSDVWLSASSEELLKLFSAAFGFLVVRGEARTIGRLSSYLEAVTLLKYAYFRNFEDTFASRNITKDFSDLVFPPGFEFIAGILFIPLSPAAGDFIIFFRANQTKEVDWAGNPKAKVGKGGQLEPRNSFKKWTEIVRGTCQNWTAEESAGMTRLVYGNFIRVWREKEADMQESRMKRLLLVNLSHELRTPLNAVVNYLEIAMEKRLEESTRAILSLSHDASKSLIYVIDDLLNLTAGAKQPTPLANLAFDLPKGLQSILDQLQSHVHHKLLTFDVITDIDFPRFVFGDLHRLQQAVSSLVTNALELTREGKGGIIIHLGVLQTTNDRCIIKISVQDSSPGMSQHELDDMFQEFEQVPDEEDVLDRPRAEGESEIFPTGGKRESKLSLGLALLSRYVKHSGGQLRGKSTLGSGSTFSLEIPLQLANEAADSLAPLSHTTSRKLVFDSGTRSEQSDGKTISTGFTSAQTEGLPLKANLTILLADDNPINLAILQRRLKKRGDVAISSRDGQHCFEMFQKHRDGIDFLLMDINPLVDGIKATTMIRAVEYNDTQILRIPIFAVSSSLDQHTQVSMEEAGFDGWLPKPIDFQRLDMILKGATCKSARIEGLYLTSNPEAGGWFT